MDTIKIAVLSAVQGLTELLPISSSGHLILLGKWFEIDTTTFLLSVFHLGTTLAIMLFFREKLFKNLFTKEKLNFYLKILVASIPAGVVGFLFQDVIEEKLRAEWIIAVSLIVWGIVMILIEQRAKKRKDVNVENVTWKQSITMGISQTFALIPGTSRSGITTISGILAGLDKYTALEYSFILGIPVLLGSSMYAIIKEILLVVQEPITSQICLVLIAKIGTVALIPFIIGYFALILLKKFKKTNWLTIFGTYRIVLGILVLVLHYLS